MRRQLAALSSEISGQPCKSDCGMIRETNGMSSDVSVGMEECARRN